MPVGTIMFDQAEASRMWDYENNEKSPKEYTITSHYKAAFVCDNKECGHSFEAFLYNMSKKGNCPYCSNHRICLDEDCNTCYQKSMASHPISEEWSLSNSKTAREVFLRTPKFKCKIDCKKCGHSFITTPDRISRSKTIKINGVEVKRTNWCPYCIEKKLCGDKTCQICRKISFANHKRAKNWIKSKNKKRPWQCFRGSPEKFWFRCDECDHEFEKQLSVIYSVDGWCPYCASSVMCKKNCTPCFFRSCASHKFANATWSRRNTKSSLETFLFSSEVVDFDCLCGHTFLARPSDVTRVKHYCPYCSPNPKRLCDNEECSTCHNKSFASHEKAKFWAIENNKTARQVFQNSKYEATFICEYDHKFTSRVHNITRGSWCPKCYFKGEKRFFEILSEFHDVEKQVRFDWCRSEKTQKHLPFDFVIHSKKVIIELDGGQHFIQVMNWKSPEETRKFDKIKMNLAYDKGYSIIRITWEFAGKMKKKWLPELLRYIEDMSQIQEGGVAVYMCEKNEYKVYFD